MFDISGVVDNRVLLLGLDELYRSAMRRHESDELLSCARAVAEALGIAAAQVPIEGYYVPSQEPSEYFLLMRALQSVEATQEPQVATLKEFRRLWEVASSPAFGEPMETGALLPQGCDALCQALQQLSPEFWSVESLVDRANKLAIETDDYSLAGLAALARDPVPLAAMRESVVLYMFTRTIGRLPDAPRIEWVVDPTLARQAHRFVDTFNSLFDEDLPVPVPNNAEHFWVAYKDNNIVGRCVRLATDDSKHPAAHYHWAIDPGSDHRGAVNAFWDDKLWTSSMYLKKIFPN